jgi:hypothetical protein
MLDSSGGCLPVLVSTYSCGKGPAADLIPTPSSITCFFEFECAENPDHGFESVRSLPCDVRLLVRRHHRRSVDPSAVDQGNFTASAGPSVRNTYSAGPNQNHLWRDGASTRPEATRGVTRRSIGNGEVSG